MAMIPKPNHTETVAIFDKLSVTDQVALMARLVHDEWHLLNQPWMQLLILKHSRYITQLAHDLLPPETVKQAVKPDLNRNIDELELPKRAINALRNGLHGTIQPITTIAELVQHSETDLRRIPNIGHNTLADIRSALADHGLCLSRQDLVASLYTPEDAATKLLDQSKRLRKAAK